MSKGRRRCRELPPDWVPRFNDPDLQRAFDEVRPVLEDYKARQAWRDQTGKQPPAGAG